MRERLNGTQGSVRAGQLDSSQTAPKATHPLCSHSAHLHIQPFDISQTDFSPGSDTELSLHLRLALSLRVTRGLLKVGTTGRDEEEEGRQRGGRWVEGKRSDTEAMM